MTIRARHAPLAFDAETFKVLGHRLVDQIAERLAAVAAGPVTPSESPSHVREALGLNGRLPEDGTEPKALLEHTVDALFAHSLFNAHPRFMGYITSSPAPIGMLGDFVASALNANVGAWTLSPAATEIEVQTVRWIAEFVGYPSACGGLLVSGGNMANMVCFWAARAAKADWDVRTQGTSGGPRLIAYASAETHTWLQKAADLSGMGTDAIRWIPVRDDLQMDLEALEQAITHDVSAGHRPFLVVGTAGSVSTGVVDPLPEIASICRSRGLWFHVDGAYGGFAAGLHDASPALRGLCEADSVAVDPHKWLYAPLEAGCALVRTAGLLRAAFAYPPPYSHFAEQATTFVDQGPQNSRGFRALKVWLAWRLVGARGYRQMIADDIALSQRLAARVGAEPDLELLTQALSITTFRFVPADLRDTRAQQDATSYLNELNRALLDALQRGGEVFVSNAVIGGRYALRSCIVNFNTTTADVDVVPTIAVRLGRSLDAQLRPTALRAGASAG
ncbi:MAG: aspartate aminotransferase family protein [Vicinamibacterales bacterium]